MKNANNYAKGYFMPPVPCYDWVKRDAVTKAPQWCSVDLRDGNQALIVPMSLDEKIEFFKILVKTGFKEIEIGFPAASETEYAFTRALIENGLIPDDVTVQVLTQARGHIIDKTFEALRGAKNAVVHLYNSVSVAQREQVFRKSKDEIKRIATDGAKMLRAAAAKTPGSFMFEYSPESFTGTEPEFALDVCNGVIETLAPAENEKVIINLPATVELSMPHVYACQVEYMSKNLIRRERVTLSLHPHNDRGCAVADTELALLAGGERVEGTLFGNGERTGNADILTIAMNMFTHGVDPKLDLSNVPMLVEAYERLTAMQVNPRAPYAGSLVFTAFSGSHQDAIAKGLRYRAENNPRNWSVPYLPLDPSDLGRSYDGDVIRINSQSGKGGIGYLMETKFGYNLPQKMREEFGYKVKDVSDRARKELSPADVLAVFQKEYVDITSPVAFLDYSSTKKDGKIHVEIRYNKDGKIRAAKGVGNGVLDAASDALTASLSFTYDDLSYSEHALESGSNARAAAYVGLKQKDAPAVWAAGVDSDIITASIKAFVGAINKTLNATK
ncbi:MAG: 2-isopropylmalate synthase [Clostridiales bacterium]|jgi:2-isopropylmalate synthase|nr:2-isopropylmalate synthase [Clostridiales bacterium]